MLTPRAVSALRSSVARSGVPTSCGDGTPPRADDVVDLVVALVEHAERRRATTGCRGRDRCAACGCARRRASVTARPRARRSRPRAARRSPTRRRRARRARSSCSGCGSRFERQGLHGLGHGRRARPARSAMPCAPLASTTARHRHVAAIGLDAVAVVARRDRRDGRAGPHRRADASRVAVDELDDLGHRHEAVGIGAVVARSPGSRLCQFGVSSRSESQRSCRQEFAISPRSSTTWSMASARQAAAHREPGMAGADDDDVDGAGHRERPRAIAVIAPRR